VRLKPFFGAMRPAAITAADVRPYVAELAATGDLSAKTINNSLAVLRVFFAHLEEDGDVVRNPARSSRGARERIKLPAEHREMDYLRFDEIPRYLDACDDVYRPLAGTLGRNRAADQRGAGADLGRCRLVGTQPARAALAQSAGPRFHKG
jgi:integrase